MAAIQTVAMYLRYVLSDAWTSKGKGYEMKRLTRTSNERVASTVSVNDVFLLDVDDRIGWHLSLWNNHTTVSNPAYILKTTPIYDPAL